MRILYASTLDHANQEEVRYISFYHEKPLACFSLMIVEYKEALSWKYFCMGISQ